MRIKSLSLYFAGDARDPPAVVVVAPVEPGVDDAGPAHGGAAPPLLQVQGARDVPGLPERTRTTCHCIF